MSTYKHEDHDGDTLEIHDTPFKKGVLITVRSRSVARSTYIPNADAPTVAAELLKAAGRTDLAGYIEAVVVREAAAAREAAEKAEAEAAEKKLQERRDALAKEFDTECDASLARYRNCTLTLRRAINRIIELEDAAK